MAAHIPLYEVLQEHDAPVLLSDEITAGVNLNVSFDFKRFGKTIVLSTSQLLTPSLALDTPISWPAGSVPLSYRPKTTLHQPFPVTVADFSVNGSITINPDGSLFMRFASPIVAWSGNSGTANASTAYYLK